MLMTLTVELVAVATHAVKAWPPLWPSDETLLVRGHLSRWAQLQARLGAAPLADHHGVPWAGLALIVLAVKSPLADHHGAYARLSSPLGSLTCNIPLPLRVCYLSLTMGT